tara:strand:- start:405 stop:608 length:204 start_codon:yes stop_codon:yes gene_type:complete
MKEKILKVFDEELKKIREDLNNTTSNDLRLLCLNSQETQTFKLLGLIKQALDLPEHEGHEYQPTYEH